MRVRRPTVAICLGVASGIAGCFYEWTLEPHEPVEDPADAAVPDTADDTADGTADAFDFDAARFCSDEPTCGGCAACAAGLCPFPVTECEAFESCMMEMACTVPRRCIECIMAHQDGFNGWECIDFECHDVCAGAPLPCQ